MHHGVVTLRLMMLVCRGYDEMKECFGDVDLSDEICLKCEDLTDCANLAIKKAAQKEGKKHEKAQET